MATIRTEPERLGAVLPRPLRAAGDGEADDRILHEAGVRAEHGQHVTLVTNDVRTLAVKLPRSVLHMRVQAFWLKHIEQTADPEGKRVEGDFSDIEREMEVRAALADPEPAGRDRSRMKPSRPPAEAVMASGSGERRRGGAFARNTGCSGARRPAVVADRRRKLHSLHTPCVFLRTAGSTSC